MRRFHLLLLLLVRSQTGVSSGFTVHLTPVLLAVAADGRFLQVFKELTSSYGVLEETDTDHVLVPDVITGLVQVEDSIIQRLLERLRVALTQFVQVVYTVVVHENV